VLIIVNLTLSHALSNLIVLGAPRQAGQRRVLMGSREVLILLTVVGSLAPPSESYAQQSTQAPIFGRIQQFAKTALDATVETSERANRFTREENFFEAARAYETLLAGWQDTPDVLITYPVLMALAGAHFGAAINRVAYGARASELKENGKLREQNLDLINNHINQVYTLVGRAAARAGESGIEGPDLQRFACAARAKLAAAVSLHGIVNSNALEFVKQIVPQGHIIGFFIDSAYALYKKNLPPEWQYLLR
jgi:hypothetical protein